MEDSGNGAYKFKYSKRGRAVIISNGRFWPGSGFENRRGAVVDRKRMKKLFTRLGFSVKDYKNLTAGEIKDTLKKVSAKEKEKHEKQKDADCFVCVISSHGEQVSVAEPGGREIHRHHKIAGVDGKTVSTADLIELFEEKKCKSLKGKPKLFFIQACRGNKYVDITDNEGWDLGIPRVSGSNNTKSNQNETVDARGSKSEELTSDSDYDTSDTEPDSDYDDPDYGLQQQKSPQETNQEVKNEEINKQKSDDLNDTVTVTCSENTQEALKQEDRNLENMQDGGDHKDTTENKTTQGNQAECAESEPSGNMGDIIDARDPNARGQRQKSLTKRPAEIVDIVEIPCYNDMLVMYASPEGKYAVSSSSGSWLISGLYLAMKEIYDFKLKDTDFLTFLMEVTNCIAVYKEFSPSEKAEECWQEKAGSKSVPCITHKLQGEMYFDDDKLRAKKNIFSMCVSGD